MSTEGTHIGGTGGVGISTRPLVDEITCSLAPNHITSDGRFIFLPEPTDRERRQFFERSIARHGLLQEDLGHKKVPEGEDDETRTKAEDNKMKEPKVHPLALASARIQSNGINELNRAINLSSLVSTGEYFGMSNIVDPSLEAPASSTANEKKDSKGGASAAAAAASAVSQALMGAKDSEEERIKSLYVLKRKRSQLLKARAVLGRHKRRLEAAIVAQAQPDQRLRELRRRWRLVAPEHGTRALPHAARPTEVLACDVDVYLDESAKLGLLTARVPRYATMELKDTYKAEADLPAWRRKFAANKISSDDMEVDDEIEKSDEGKTKEAPVVPVWTVAEPFVIADPTLGKLDADFDPKNVTIFSLEFEIEKAFTGFRQSSVLQPISDDPSSGPSSSALSDDEQTLHSLQHSLFCAKLFESIRRELAPDTEEVGTLRTAAAPQSVVWLSHECETNYLPPPSCLSGDRTEEDLEPLAVLHCHEGEVKVQLDAEYALCVRLVEAPNKAALQSVVDATRSAAEPVGDRADDDDCADDSRDRGTNSGSQSPRRLLWLCRALLHHAEERYHEHSQRQAAATASAAAAAAAVAAKNANHAAFTDVHARKREVSSPRILQSCVTLGSKLLLEHRIRRSLHRLQEWVRTSQAAGAVLEVEWLPLSVLDRQAHFTLAFGTSGGGGGGREVSQWWVADAHVCGDRISLTRTGPDCGDYRKATFRSEVELELHLRLSFQRLLRWSQQQQQQQQQQRQQSPPSATQHPEPEQIII